MWSTYEAYCKEMKRFGAEPLPEEIWRREYAPKAEAYREPLIIRPKKPTVKQSLTVEESNHPVQKHEKVPQPKKKYAPKQCRKGWTQEQIKARKAENVRRYRENKKKTAA